MLCLFLPLFCSRFSAIKWNRSPFDTCSLQLLRSFPSDFSVCNDRLVPPDLFHPSRYNTIHQTQLFLPATSSNLFSSSFLSSFCLATQSVNNCFLYPDRQTSFPRFFPFSLIQDFDRVCSIIISYHLTDSLYFCFFFFFLSIWVGIANHSIFSWFILSPFVSWNLLTARDSTSLALLPPPPKHTRR